MWIGSDSEKQPTEFGFACAIFTSRRIDLGAGDGHDIEESTHKRLQLYAAIAHLRGYVWTRKVAERK